MPLVVGLNHETAPLPLREKLANLSAHLSETLWRLKEPFSLNGMVLLSTCHRIEIYACSTHRAETREALARQLQAQAQVESLRSCLYYQEGEKAVRHLFRVASGLDSMVKGENEILNQVKQAYLSAKQNGSTDKLLNVLFQRSLYVGKRVRTETALSSGFSSIGSLAVTMAECIFGSLRDRRILILGAGKMAEQTAKVLLSQNVKAILVSNRTFERAQELAAQFGGQAIPFEEGLRQMALVDVVICSTAAPHPVIGPELIKTVMQRRQGQPLSLIDIAVPRDVDPAVQAIDNVHVYNIDDLQSIVDDSQSKRSREIQAAEILVEEETREFARWLQAHRSGCWHGLRHHPTPCPAAIA
ncbi:MAG: glutamyl-tRNA reductase [Elusimicrobiota bacterium]|jgi:glutamyl-tRNA reductase